MLPQAPAWGNIAGYGSILIRRSPDQDAAGGLGEGRGLKPRL